MRAVLIVCVLVSVLGWIVAAPAQVPATTSYQGVLKDAGGENVPDGDYDFTFSLYDVPSEGTALWTEAQTLSVAEGIFNATLGAVAPLDLPFDVPYWLGVAVAPEEEMTPREELMTAPYAFRAAVAESLVGGGGADTDWVEAGGNVYRLTGKVGIGTTTPEFKLTVADDGGILATGVQGEGATLATAGPGTRMIWYPRKSALRAGRVSADQWDDANIATAGGDYAIAIGLSSESYGWRSITLGSYTRAGLRALAIGNESEASGSDAISIGNNVAAQASKSIVIGTGIDDANPLLNPIPNSLVVGFNDTEALLFAGGPDKRVGVGTTAPEELLDVEGTAQVDGFKMPTGASDGHVLTSDATGVATWQAAPGGGGLTLPYAGSSDETGTIFSISTSQNGPAIKGSRVSVEGSRAGYLAESNAGVRGIDLSTGNQGRLGTPSYAGHFDGDVLVSNGNVGIGVGLPPTALSVAGAVKVESDTTYADHVIHAEYTGSNPDAVAVYGNSSAAGGLSVGGEFEGNTYGVVGRSVDPTTEGCGVLGRGTAAFGPIYGVMGQALSMGGGEAVGVYGFAMSDFGTAYAGKFFGDVDVSETIYVDGFSMPGGAEGHVLTSDADGDGTWQAPAGGGIGGSGVANWIPVFTDSMTLGQSPMEVSGISVFMPSTSKAAPEQVSGRGLAPAAGDDMGNERLVVYGEDGRMIVAQVTELDDSLDGRAAFWGGRTAVSEGVNPGSSFGHGDYGTNNAITGFNTWADNYTFGVAGYTYGDFPDHGLSGGVLGYSVDTGVWGSLGYQDVGGVEWGVYTPDDSYVGGALSVESSAQRAAEFMSDNSSDVTTDVVYAEYTGSTPGRHHAAFRGKSNQFDHSGYGGSFTGGYAGIRAVNTGQAYQFGEFYYGSISISERTSGGARNCGAYGRAKSFEGTSYGVHGVAHDTGEWGGTACGVYGEATGGGHIALYGVYGSAPDTNGVAGHFNGDVAVVGTLSKSAGSFKIDHPLDPENKYLSHSFVESPDMMNIYNGNVVLDAAGEAGVELPEWFDALNTDFRYQLTAIGAPGPNLYIAEKISGNRLRIGGGEPGMEVSWQVTGVRQDAYTRANRIPVEEDKPVEDRGKYRHPELFGKPRTEAIDYLEPPGVSTSDGR